MTFATKKKLTQNKKQIVAIQADDYSSLNPLRDTTLLIAYNLAKLGFEIFWYRQKDLILEDEQIYADGQIVLLESNDSGFNCKPIENNKRLNLAEVFLVLIRNDPPVDMAYITATMLLEKIANQTLILNDPTSLRNHCEKILPLTLCPKNCPETLITANVKSIVDFSKKHQGIVLKPLFACGGSGVFHTDKVLSYQEVIKYLKNQNHNPIIAQKYLAEVTNGDKRIFVFNGEILGSIKRKPKTGGFLSNLCQGATALRIGITENEAKIAEDVAKKLQQLKIIFAAIDMIDGYVIEINTTSPTGLQEYSRLYDIDIGRYLAQSMVEITHKFYGIND